MKVGNIYPWGSKGLLIKTMSLSEDEFRVALCNENGVLVNNNPNHKGFRVSEEFFYDKTGLQKCSHIYGYHEGVPFKYCPECGVKLVYPIRERM